MTLGARLKARRKTLGLTQTQLSEKSNVAQSTIVRNERDQAAPDSATLSAYAKSLHVTVAWLLDGDGPEPAMPDQSNDALDDHRATDGVDIAPREAETPSTFGGFANYARVEKTARALAPEIPDWVWSATRNTHPLWLSSDPPGAQVVADVARLIMKHRPDK